MLKVGGGTGPGGMWADGVTVPKGMEAVPLSGTPNGPLVANPGDTPNPAKLFYVDLDQPPEQRWRHVYEDEWSKEVLKRHVGVATKECAKPKDKEYVANVVKCVDAQLSDDYRTELKEISRMTGMDYNLLLQYQAPLETNQGVGCSAILGLQEDGTAVMAKNYDYDPLTSDDMMQVIFKKGGKDIFTSIGHNLLRTGVHSCMRYGAYGVTQNTQMQSQGKEERLALMQKGGVACFLHELRKILETAADYDTLVQRLSEPIFPMAHHYPMVSGDGRGCMLTTSAMGAPRVQKLDAQAGRWFIVQTNDRWWESAWDNRREWAVRNATAMGRSGLSEESALAVIQQKGITNILTDFHCAMTPAKNTTRFVRAKEKPNNAKWTSDSVKLIAFPMKKGLIKYMNEGGIKEGPINGPACVQGIFSCCLGPLLMMCAKD